MASTNITDWVVSLGVEVDSKAGAKIKSLEERIAKIAKVTEEAEKVTAKASKASVSASEQKVAGLSKERSFRGRQITTLRSIATLEKAGATKEQAAALRRQTDAAKNVAQLQEARLATKELLLKHKELNNERARAAKPVVAKAAKTVDIAAESARVEAKQYSLRSKLISLKSSGASKEQADGMRSQVMKAKTIAQLKKIELAITREITLQRELNAERARAVKTPVHGGVAQKPQPQVTGERAFNRNMRDQMGFKGAVVNPQGKLNEAIGRAEGLKSPLGDISAKELRDIHFAMIKLGKEAKKVDANFEKLGEEMNHLRDRASKVNRELNKQTKSLHKQNLATKALTNSATHLLSTYASVFALMSGSRAFFNLGKDIESTKAVMLAATGSAKEAAIAFDFVQAQALRLGQSVKVSAKSFAKFGAAARGSGLSLAETKEMFTAISEVNLAFQLDAQSSGLAFLAFEQMLSKGTVSMEELRRQLGERWPGAFKQAANSMGITTTEMNKLVSSGKLMSKDFVGKFVKQMSSFVKESGAFEKALEKVATAHGTMVGKMEKAVGISFDRSTSGFHSFFTNIGFAIEELMPAINVFGKVFSELGRVVGFVAVALSPVIGLIATSFDTLFGAIERTSDSNLAFKNLTIIEAVLRAVAIVANMAALAILSVSWVFAKLADMLGVNKDASSGLLQQFIALNVVFFSTRKVLKLLWGVLKAFGKKLMWAGGLLGRAAGALGLVKTQAWLAAISVKGLGTAYQAMSIKAIASLAAVKKAGMFLKAFAPVAVAEVLINKATAETEEEDTNANVGLGLVIGGGLLAGAAALIAAPLLAVGGTAAAALAAIGGTAGVTALGVMAGTATNMAYGDDIAKSFGNKVAQDGSSNTNNITNNLTKNTTNHNTTAEAVDASRNSDDSFFAKRGFSADNSFGASLATIP